MAFNYNSGYTTSAAPGDSSRMDAYSYYYQNLYGLPANNYQGAAYFSADTTGQGQPSSVYNFHGTPSYPYATGQEYQSGSETTPRIVPVVPTPIPKTVGGRSRSPVERVLRYRLDDNEASSLLIAAKHSGNPSLSARPSKRLLPDNRGYNTCNNGFASLIPIPPNGAMLFNNAEEKRNIELQLNEAMFIDKLFEVNFTSSWYKLKKKDETGVELVCVVVEIIDCDNKVYKVYGGYTSNMRSKEMAFGQAIKKLDAIIAEKEKEKLDKAKQLITNAIISNTDISTLPFTSGSLLVPNPLYNPSTLAKANSSIYSQSYDQPVPPGTEHGTNEYDPVNYSYDYNYPRQPLPPGTEKNVSEVSVGNQQEMIGDQPLQTHQKQKSTTDRPCAGRGEYEDKFTRKAKQLGYVFRCLKTPPKRHFNIEYFSFEIQFVKSDERLTRSKLTGSSLRDEGQARESVYAMAFDKLEKIDKMQSEKTKKDVDYECEWITPVPASLSLPKSNNSNQKTENSFLPMRKVIEAPNWDWDSTSNDLSIMKCLPTFSMGRGKPKTSDSDIRPGGDILDHREWRWPAK